MLAGVVTGGGHQGELLRTLLIFFFFNLGANYIGYSVVENPSAAHLISQFCVDIFYISIKLNNGPKLASQ